MYYGINSKRKCAICDEWISLKEINSSAHVTGYHGSERVFHDGKCFEIHKKNLDLAAKRHEDMLKKSPGSFIGDGTRLTGLLPKTI